MSSDDFIDDYHRSGGGNSSSNSNANNKTNYHHQLSPKKLHNQQLTLTISNDNGVGGGGGSQNHIQSIATASTQTLNCCDMNGTVKRRKSASSITPITLSVAVGNPNEDDEGLSSAASSSQQYNSNAKLQSNYSYTGSGGGSGCSSTGKTNINASPSRYLHHNDGIYLQLNNTLPSGNRLTIHHPNSSDRFEQEITTCCLPPPSPAPNSDRFIMGIPSPSIASHYHTLNNASDHKFSTLHHRSMSPTSR